MMRNHFKEIEETMIENKVELIGNRYREAL